MLPAGDGRWVAFDPDLLRVAAVWWGKGVTPTALAPGSYHQPDRKTPAGQKALPQPDGPVAIANGIYAGWQVGDQPGPRGLADAGALARGGWPRPDSRRRTGDSRRCA